MTQSRNIRVPASKSLGKVYNHFTVLKILAYRKRAGAMVSCRCRCGVIKIVPLSRLRDGSLKSCGCWRREQSKTAATKHGMRFIPEYQVWLQAVERCRNPKNKGYKNYGGRGIFVCDRWKKFENFIADMGRRPTDKHTLERENNNGPYSPDNCTWATRIKQASNTRRVILVTYENITMSIRRWAFTKGICYGTLYYRVKAKWPIEKALNLRP